MYSSKVSSLDVISAPRVTESSTFSARTRTSSFPVWSTAMVCFMFSNTSLVSCIIFSIFSWIASVWTNWCWTASAVSLAPSATSSMASPVWSAASRSATAASLIASIPSLSRWEISVTWERRSSVLAFAWCISFSFSLLLISRTAIT